MGTTWQAAGPPDECYRDPQPRTYRPRHAAPPGFLRALLRPGDPAGPRELAGVAAAQALGPGPAAGRRHPPGLAGRR